MHVKPSEERLIFQSGIILTDGFYYGQSNFLSLTQFIGVAQIYNYFQDYELPYSDGIVEPEDFVRAVQDANMPPIYNSLVVNKLFIDMEQITKNMQVLLNNYEMHVIAQVSQITQHVATKDDYGCVKLGLQEGQRYSRCKVCRVDHIVNFTSRILGKQPGNGENDYSFTDYIFK